MPVISTVIGEGGSGGALAIGVANRVLMLENSIYSVISPRGLLVHPLPGHHQGGEGGRGAQAHRQGPPGAGSGGRAGPRTGGRSRTAIRPGPPRRWGGCCASISRPCSASTARRWWTTATGSSGPWGLSSAGERQVPRPGWSEHGEMAETEARRRTRGTSSGGVPRGTSSSAGLSLRVAARIGHRSGQSIPVEALVRPFIVAIDGPAGAGKSTVSKLLARRLGLSFVDTGAIYRTVALAARREGIGYDDDAALESVARSDPDRLPGGGEENRVFLDERGRLGRDPPPRPSRSWGRGVRRPVVRQGLLGLQRRLRWRRRWGRCWRAGTSGRWCSPTPT